MDSNINNATTSVADKKREKPLLGGQEFRINNMAIDCVQDLEEGVTYMGEITDCYGTANSNAKTFLKLVITLGDEVTAFESSHMLPLPNWSPLKAFIAELEAEQESKVDTTDLIGIEVQFTVEHNTGTNGVTYCNLKTIDFVYDEPTEPSEDTVSESKENAPVEEVTTTDVPAKDVVTTSTDDAPIEDEDDVVSWLDEEEDY